MLLNMKKTVKEIHPVIRCKLVSMYTVARKKISKLHLNIVVALVVYNILIDEARIIFYLVSPQLYYASTKQNLQAYLYWLTCMRTKPFR